MRDCSGQFAASRSVTQAAAAAREKRQAAKADLGKLNDTHRFKHDERMSGRPKKLGTAEGHSNNFSEVRLLGSFISWSSSQVDARKQALQKALGADPAEAASRASPQEHIESCNQVLHGARCAQELLQLQLPSPEVGKLA